MASTIIKTVTSSSSILLARTPLSHPFCRAATLRRSDERPEVRASMDPVAERYNKEATDQSHKAKPSPSANGLSDSIMPHILNLYASRATPRDFEIYADDATFEDPLMHAIGIQQIKSAFYSIPKVFKESRIVEYTVQENEISPGKHEVLVDNKQYYKFLGRDIDMISLIKLYVENGKVIRHEDWWDKQPPRNRETANIKIFGRVMEAMRRGAMLATHAMMGFGKEPQQEDKES